MIISTQAAFALLFLLFQTPHQVVCGEHPTIATKLEHDSDTIHDPEKQTRTSLRLPLKETHADAYSLIGTRYLRKDDDEGGDSAWPTYTPTSFDETSPEFIATSFQSGYMRDPTTEETISISMETNWPTYFPTAFATRAPTIATPSFGIASSSYNCDPIGSRTNYNEKPALPTPTAHPMSKIVVPDAPAAPTVDEDPTPHTSSSPIGRPTRRPFDEGEESSAVTFRRGDMLKNIERLGIKVSKGITVRVLARANSKVNYGNGKKSKLPFHRSPDGAAVFPLKDGYVYVSNSNAPKGNGGGVYGLYFDHDGKVVEYEALLNGTTMNSGGGTTPWGTFVSCEEYEKGQCWQVDPDPSSKHHSQPEQTMLGGAGGLYEAVACDDRNPSHPTFFVTEDNISGALRKYTPPPSAAGVTANWDSLHLDGGETEYLFFLEGNKFKWSSDESLGRTSQRNNYPNVEGTNYHDGMLYFVSNKTMKLFVLNLDEKTYVSSPTTDYVLYSGVFKNSPDQLVRNGKFLYFTEDGGETPGVYSIDSDGKSYSIFEAYDEKYFQDETTGLSFSPDGTTMYACFQDCGCTMPGDIDCGCLLSFWRDDGLPFGGATMRLKLPRQKM